MIKQVIVIRTDLNMRKGKMCAQAAHASMKIFFDRMNKEDDDEYNFGRDHSWEWSKVKEWIDGAFTKIVVGCNSGQELLELESLAKEKQLPTALICDSGATEFSGVPTLTALAIGPADSDDINLITGHLKLL